MLHFWEKAERQDFSTLLLDAPSCLAERPLIGPRIDGTHQKGLKISNDNW
jgi:hypothetical protein